QTSRNTATLVGRLPKSTGNVQRVKDSVVYFGELKQMADPTVAGLTTLQGIRGASSLKAITDSSGQIVVINPIPGTVGSLSQAYFDGPGSFRFDTNLIKHIRIREDKELQVRADFINVLNSPQFHNPNTDINDTNFGRVTSANDGRII